MACMHTRQWEERRLHTLIDSANLAAPSASLSLPSLPKAPFAAYRTWPIRMGGCNATPQVRGI